MGVVASAVRNRKIKLDKVQKSTRVYSCVILFGEQG